MVWVTFRSFKVFSIQYMMITQTKTFKILKKVFNWVHYVTFHLCARVTKRQTDSYRAQRVYFGLWHSKSMLCLCLGKTFFIHLLSTGLPGRSADTVHFPDEGGGWTLCLSSDMFSTCNARSNRQISLWLWLNNSLCCKKGWSCLSPLPLFRLFPHYCHKDVEQGKTLHCSTVLALFHVSFISLLYSFTFSFSLSFSQHTRGDNLAIHFQPRISFSHLLFMPTRACSTPFSSPTWWCGR